MGSRGPQRQAPVKRFLVLAQRGAPDECWPWLGFVDKGGYGSFWDGTRQIGPHRFAYETFVGSIPEGEDIDHLCHDPRECGGGVSCMHRRCVNPAHLAPATRQENVARGGAGGLRAGGAPERQREKTHCPRGHPYSEENTYSPPSRPTARYCRTCHLEQTRERRARQR